MNDAKALAEIQRLAQLDRIVYSDHAQVRMSERNARPSDVRHALLTATAAISRPTARTGGFSAAWIGVGTTLRAVVDIWADLVVVTIF